MSFVVTLTGYAPPPRTDSNPFRSAKIEEAATLAGPWTAIQTIALNPLDTDALKPIAREFTSGHAQYAEGFYRVVWVDNEGGETAPTEPVQNMQPGGTRPSVAEVAAKLRARTKVRGGAELGVFTEATRPTASEVDSLIDDALDDVLGKVQAPTAGSKYERRVRGAVCLYAAILVELSYFPEMVGTPKSPYDAYMKLYESRLKALIAEGETGEPQGEGGSGDAPADPAWTFPEGELLGYGTRW